MSARLATALDSVTDPGTRTSFRIGLEAVESATGRLVANPHTGYEGEGIGFRVGDLLFGKLRPNLAKAWLADRPGAAVGDFLVLRPKVGVSGRYLIYVVLSDAFLGQINASVFGAKMPRTDWSAVRNFRTCLPPLGEQLRIADFLDAETAQIDDLIAEQERFVGLLRERRAAEVACRLEATLPAAEGRRLKHLVRTVAQGWSPQAHPWPTDGVKRWAVLKAGAVNHGVFRSAENKELPEDLGPRPDVVVRRGDLVVSRANTRELVGSAAVVLGDYPKLMLSDKLYALRLNLREAEPRYVALALGSRKWRDLIEMCAVGASFSMQNIALADLMDLPMDLPTVETQRRVLAEIDEAIDRICRLTSEAQHNIALSKERRAALITAAVTGQIDVSTGRAS